MHKSMDGFTLIELVVVIVILGILAAVAVPKFVDLKSDAQTNSAAYTTGNNTEQANANWAKCVAKSTKAECDIAFPTSPQV